MKSRITTHILTKIKKRNLMTMKLTKTTKTKRISIFNSGLEQIKIFYNSILDNILTEIATFKTYKKNKKSPMSPGQ